MRIAAGALVLTGALLGYFVNPASIALSGFVGAGLVFAGITDTCGIGMLIARMPRRCVFGNCQPAIRRQHEIQLYRIHPARIPLPTEYTNQNAR